MHILIKGAYNLLVTRSSCHLDGSAGRGHAASAAVFERCSESTDYSGPSTLLIDVSSVNQVTSSPFKDLA